MKNFFFQGGIWLKKWGSPTTKLVSILSLELKKFLRMLFVLHFAPGITFHFFGLNFHPPFFHSRIETVLRLYYFLNFNITFQADKQILENKSEVCVITINASKIIFYEKRQIIIITVCRNHFVLQSRVYLKKPSYVPPFTMIQSNSTM